MGLPTGNRVRRHVFHEITRSLCLECGRLVDAQVLFRDGRVYLRKHCPEHGWQEAMVCADADWYLSSLAYNKPGQIPADFATAVARGCPSDCGLCPEHQQHTCIGVIEVTTACNLACPTCFADSGPGYQLTLAEVEAILDRFLQTESRPEVLQISGGEPTLHPDIVAIIAAAQARGIRHVMLNTNGIRLALDPGFVRTLADYQPSIYLQFDGLSAGAHQALRGADLRAVKQQALDNVARAGLHAVLVPTIVQGLNDGEIGDILRFGLEHPAVLGVCYQPVAATGRTAGLADPLDRSTVTGIIHQIESQTGGLFQVSDFRPIPCPYPSCSACTYAYVDGQRVIPVPRLLNVDDYLHLAVNRTAADLSDDMAAALDGLWSMSAVVGGEKTTEALACVACGTDILPMLEARTLRQRFFMVQIHGFMDRHTFDLRRLMKCCVHQLLPDGRAVPLCAYNNLHYRQQTRLQLSRRNGSTRTGVVT